LLLLLPLVVVLMVVVPTGNAVQAPCGLQPHAVVHLLIGKPTMSLCGKVHT
jgi:hypothetical protein